MIKAEAVTQNSELQSLNLSEHGGNIYKLAEELGIPESKLVDFSASINPLGISRKVKDVIIKNLDGLINYPDPDMRLLRENLSEHHGIDPETILCANGSTELIYLIPRTLKPKKVLVPAPTFSEYERACRISRGEAVLRPYKLKKENNFEINPDEFISAIRGDMKSKVKSQKSKVGARCDMAFLCNPNNPTGHLLKSKDVLRVAEAARYFKCVLVVDEAFIDFKPEESVIGHVQDNPYLIALRSMTKFYALTGLRIGYGVFPVNLISAIKEFKEPWTVNNLAQKTAIAALQDSEYADKTQRLIKSEKEFLENSFNKMGIKYFPSDANYYLLRILKGNNIVQKLRGKGILVRDCSNFKGLDGTYIRVAVKSRRHNRLLIRELSNI